MDYKKFISRKHTATQALGFGLIQQGVSSVFSNQHKLLFQHRQAR